MKIFIFDPYKSGNFKINKDQAGGYGTSNEIGNNIFSLTLAAFLKKNINYAPMFAIYTFTVLKNKGFDVEYTKSYSDIKSCDLCLVTSSTVCHETEIYYLKKLKEQNKLLKEYEDSKNFGLHVHCPEGAVSKDGPSAGGAITLSIYSLLNNKPIKNTISMTGETNLRGK